MSKILIIEDSTDINALLAETLGAAGFETESAFDGINGQKAALSGRHDLIITDIMLPFLSGDEILRKLRERSNVPVIVISAKDTVSTKIDLLKMGADDYITKPFDLGEVVARVETALRRAGGAKASSGTVLRYKDIALDCSDMRITVGGREVKCTAKETQILEMLLRNPDKVFTKSNIYETVWQEDYLGDDNAVKTHISNLRSKLERLSPGNQYIETVWGLGYRLYKN
ncbi:MAG: response regulator transcription factor [Clostridia bacterium]|nr:response regulator transcription factor [Clostridia bacterium]